MMSQTCNNTQILDVERLDRCPVCASLELRFWCKGFDRLYRVSPHEFTYSECKICGLVFLSERPYEEDISKFYPANYGPYRSEREAAANGSEPAAPSRAIGPRESPSPPAGLFRSLFRRTDDILEQYGAWCREFESNPTLLDFGCGSDRFLNRARAAGWATVGIDFSPAVVERIRESGHRAFLGSPHVWREIEDGSLSLVRMNHVLEHLYHPKEVLAAIYAKLKPGGVLHIGVPNPRGVSSWLFGSRWFGLDCPRHIMLFGPRGLRQELLRQGFRRVRVCHEPLTKDLGRSIGHVLAERGVIKHEDVPLMEFKRSLNALLYAPVRLAALLRRSDRIVVFAVK